jgi:hypothetical protein
VLIFQRKLSLRVRKNRISDPSEIRALEFKGQFRRPAMCSVLATIDVDRPIFSEILIENDIVGLREKDRQRLNVQSPVILEAHRRRSQYAF